MLCASGCIRVGHFQNEPVISKHLAPLVRFKTSAPLDFEGAEGTGPDTTVFPSMVRKGPGVT